MITPNFGFAVIKGTTQQRLAVGEQAASDDKWSRSNYTEGTEGSFDLAYYLRTRASIGLTTGGARWSLPSDLGRVFH